MEELEKLRDKIDELDKQIADLIYERQNLSNKILRAKKGLFTYDPAREKKLMKKIFSYKLNSKLAERIWRQIIGFNLSEQKKLKIGYLTDDNISFAAYDSYFGPFFYNVGFENAKDMIKNLDKEKIDLAIIDNSLPILKNRM